ncbi:MAG: hypothetical protein UY70_C0006G0029 [Candidatus Kaiserbacteria bacterium GW2011_GWB1_52_6]|uniref:BioF2-like acetyltransferase domain-containing protein n=2 Tax=Candidatus Kaiseribacteriota TaxID=1752734 RepID=A0A0G1XJX9_9BACT|nr:MAG: hypothetical protein UY70_C0006G0029 [Candidatus Kaiserbacteria bacterium GW2011_GWB1_52_6]KKW31568.1 MAG: hypothetical protein UY74_C0011G0011 [Candidatus Kaiserbacteria bacterium GW2011_GWC2_52_8b]
MEIKGSGYSYREISDVHDTGTLWQKIADQSADAWVWHTWAAHEFNVCAATQYDVVDRSFFVYEGDLPVGVVPLTFQKSSRGIEAIYYSGFLPWPALCHVGAGRRLLEEGIFEEIERRAKDHGVSLIRFWFTPPVPGVGDDERTAHIAQLFGYDRTALAFHEVEIDSDTLSRVRDRYRRYHKKYFPLFLLRIAEGNEVTSDLAKNYAELHRKDSGRTVRSLESFERQADSARSREGFYVIAETPDKTIAGMLLISLYKGVAYDSSVAIDPEFAELYVGHLLKWKTIEELQRRNVASYVLGPAAGIGASPKEVGISHFKDGWSRGNTQTVWQLEKVMSRR